jgi:Fe-S cluster assembly iron-binding protein IscA
MDKSKGKAIPVIKLEPGAGQAIKALLAEKKCQGPVRIDLHSTGCCDVSLGLSVGQMRDADLIEEVDGLKFAMSQETYQLVGAVTISYDEGRKGFVLTSSKPVSEWEGFGACTIEILPEGK